MTVLATRPELLAPKYDKYAGVGADAMAAATQVGQGGIKRKLTASTLADFKAKYAALQPGDWLEAKGVHFTGEVVLRKTLAGWAKVTLDSACTITGMTAQMNASNFWFPHIEHVIFLIHCDLTNKLGGAGIVVYRGNHFVIEVFEPAMIHSVGGSGVALLPAVISDSLTDIENFFVRARVHDIGQHLAYDPHFEKGTGQHCCISSDANGGAMHHGTIAIHGHSCGQGNLSGGGSVIEIGQDPSHPNFAAHDIEIYEQGEDMLFVAKSQTGGNGVNNWGLIGQNVVEHIWHQDSMGFASSTDSAGAPSKAGVTVVEGAAKNVCQNPRYKGQSPWEKRGGIHYAAALVPAP